MLEDNMADPRLYHGQDRLSKICLRQISAQSGSAELHAMIDVVVKGEEQFSDTVKKLPNEIKEIKCDMTEKIEIAKKRVDERAKEEL